MQHQLKNVAKNSKLIENGEVFFFFFFFFFWQMINLVFSRVFSSRIVVVIVLLLYCCCFLRLIVQKICLFICIYSQSSPFSHCFLHYCLKISQRHRSNAPRIGLCNHFNQIVVGQSLVQVSNHRLQVFERNETSLSFFCFWFLQLFSYTQAQFENKNKVTTDQMKYLVLIEKTECNSQFRVESFALSQRADNRQESVE